MNRYLIARSVLLSGLVLSANALAFLQAPNLFGAKYQPVLPVVKEQTQIVYYRTQTAQAQRTPANVYVDGRYHTSLLPGGYTSFCIKPGWHTLGAYVNDPKYLGKTQGRFEAQLQGGHTYFLRVNEQQQLSEPPEAVARHPHEADVRKTRRQIHAHSRATMLEPCVYDRSVSQPPSSYVFNARQLFKHESGRWVLSDEGLSAINEAVVSLRQQHPILNDVIIRLVSEQRQPAEAADKARAIRNALLLAAIPQDDISQDIIRCDENCPVQIDQIQILAK